MKQTSLAEIPEQPVTHNPEIKKKVMLSPGELPHLTNFSQARFSPGQVAPGHFHDNMYEVFFVEAGEGIIRVDGQDYPVKKGSCIAVEPGEFHEVINSGDTDLILTYFGLKS
ncbi:MAG: cupin domain-containing protein [Gomphosphaeria aponina SAG 52.96 = DSM 107014]|uniref:Cupin domain-containing protein n=1 Tax=Gomphosphaeria aponina SAG 52.96 = DSM 107014 TaxID=1521640 RepID=A0A941JVH5_9CHRO|nr:cupin domain-containing protein [Gomphosphaeria aponina SAG 52.96 = DSM 107014]